MGHRNNSSYIAGITHPSSWIHTNDQLLLAIGTGMWFALALIGIVYLVFTFSTLHRRYALLTGIVRIIIVCAMLGVAYMYTGARMLLFEREDDVIVHTPLVAASAALNLVLVHVGSQHCVLSKHHATLVMWLAVMGTGLMTLASFVSSVQQWPGWVVGALFFVPIPFAWVALQKRHPRAFNAHVVGWTFTWIIFRVAYAVLQLLGHSFTGIDTTAELALTFVLHTATLVPLCYAFWWTRCAAPKPPKVAEIPPETE